MKLRKLTTADYVFLTATASLVIAIVAMIDGLSVTGWLATGCGFILVYLTAVLDTTQHEREAAQCGLSLQEK